MTASITGIVHLAKKTFLAGVIAAAATGCVTLDQKFSQTSHSTGAKLYNAGDYEGAAGAYINATKKEPRDYKAYYYMACSYDAMKASEKAIHAYKTSLDVMALTWAGKQDAEFRQRVLDGLARSIARSNTRQVELDLAEKQARAKHDAEPYYLVGKIYKYSGDADLAIENLNRANLLDPENMYIVRELGLYFEQIGQTQRAEPALRRAYALGARDEETLASMRRIGLIPGPAIKSQKDLAQPALPDITLPTAATPRD